LQIKALRARTVELGRPAGPDWSVFFDPDLLRDWSVEVSACLAGGSGTVDQNLLENMH
jgi:hypothetical protein